MHLRLILAAISFLLVLPLTAAPLTNADVIKMTQAELAESIMITAIQNSEPGFDTTTDGLIELSVAKVPEAVIEAMIRRSAAPAAVPVAPAPGAQPVSAESLMAPSEIIMIDGESTHSMRYLSPQMRTAARGLGFGGFASYAVLRGSSATLRTSNGSPSFLVSVPNQAQPESYFTLASFAVRSNNSREVLVGGGYMSYSTGIHPDRVMAVDSVRVEDQSRAQAGFTIYRVTPRQALQAGEYAVILYTGEMAGLVGTWFTGTGNSYFDFSVGP